MSEPGLNRSRRGFLLGVRAPNPPQQRPPWSLIEHAFASACNGCGACIAACPEEILVIDSNHLAQVDFSRGQQACTFCGACADACPEPAFLAATARAALPPWSWQARIGDACLTHQGIMCQSCKDACGEGAILFAYGAARIAEPRIDLALCTGCGACAAPCPAAAITFQQAEAANG